MVLVFNHGLYRFFQQRRGLGFALRVMPIHLLFYLANGFAAVWAWILFHVIGAPAPPADVQAYAEKGLKTWPPQPTKASWVGGASRSSK